MMTKHPKFLGFGLLLLSGITGLQWYGLGSVSPNELRNVPKTIRDNPGAWRWLVWLMRDPVLAVGPQG